VPDARAKRHNAGQPFHDAGAIEDAAVAELAVAPAAEREQTAVFGERQRVICAGFDRDQRSDAIRYGNWPEHLVRNAFDGRTLAHVRRSRAVQLAGAAECDAEVLSRRDLDDALAFE
jgi:hypothetical protein